MKIHLKERSTGLWLKPSGRWESSREGAQDFDSSLEARARAASTKSLDIQVCIQGRDFDCESPSKCSDAARAAI